MKHVTRNQKSSRTRKRALVLHMDTSSVIAHQRSSRSDARRDAVERKRGWDEEGDENTFKLAYSRFCFSALLSVHSGTQCTAYTSDTFSVF
jgi:hypothetical protein